MNLWFFSSGDGDSNAEMDEALLEQMHVSRPRFTFIPSCFESSDYYYDEFIDRFGQYGYKNFSLLHLDQPQSNYDFMKALDSDLIYLSGGNTFYFLKFLRQSGFDRPLKEFVNKGGVLAGHSAGAILMTPNINTASYPEHDRDPNEVEITNLQAMRLVKFEFFPHYRGGQTYDPELVYESKQVDHPIYAVPDGSGIWVNKNHVTFFGRIFAFVKGSRFRITF